MIVVKFCIVFNSDRSVQEELLSSCLLNQENENKVV